MGDQPALDPLPAGNGHGLRIREAVVPTQTQTRVRC